MPDGGNTCAASGVNWQDITGFHRGRDLFNLFDEDKDFQITYKDRGGGASEADTAIQTLGPWFRNAQDSKVKEWPDSASATRRACHGPRLTWRLCLKDPHKAPCKSVSMSSDI